MSVNKNFGVMFTPYTFFREYETEVPLADKLNKEIIKKLNKKENIVLPKIYRLNE